MKALSVRQPFAELIASGAKLSEFRTWPTSHHGPLLIVAGRQRFEFRGEDPYPKVDGARGRMVCVVDLVDVSPDCDEDGDFEWTLANPRRVDEVAVSGRVKLFEVADALIRPIRPCSCGSVNYVVRPGEDGLPRTSCCEYH